MAGLNITIPSINESYYDSVSADKNKKKIIELIRPKYGILINKISSYTLVPSQLIEGVMFIESAGNEKAESPYAIGLMQVSKATASDVIVKEKGAGRLKAEESAILKKYLPYNTWKEIEKVKPKQKSLGKTFVTRDMLLKPEFNILIGAMLLGQLIDEFTDSKGNVRLDKVISIYNGGRSSKSSKKIIPFTGSTKELLTIAPKETSDYIKKLVGKNSVLDVLV